MDAGGSSAGHSLATQGWAALAKGDYGTARALRRDAASENPSNAAAQYCMQAHVGSPECRHVADY